MRIGVYPGSFDPVTNGHIEILRRSIGLFDKVIFLLAVNPAKKSVFSIEDRLVMMKEVAKEFSNVEVDFTPGLIVDYCQKIGSGYIIRGLRAVTDFEYEFQMAAANEFANPNIDMVFFMSRKEETFISSTAINELHCGGKDISSLVPPIVVKMFKDKEK